MSAQPIELWQELEEATEAPRSVNFELLWSVLEEAIEHLPQAQQLAIAGNADTLRVSRRHRADGRNYSIAINAANLRLGSCTF